MRVSPEVELPVVLLPCPLCGGLDFDKLAGHDRHLLGLVTVGCKRCGLMQTNPRPDATGLADFYAHHYRELYQGVVDPDAEYVARFRKDRRLRYTAQHLLDVLPVDDESAILDYGCGEGSLFGALREAGYAGRLLGVETNPRFAGYAARTSGAEVRATPEGFEDLDAVLLNHVLEHLSDPVNTLHDLRRRLKPGGWLYIDVPDADRYDSVSDLHLAHILHFTERTLVAIVRNAGFQVVSCERHDPPHHPRSIRLRARPHVDSGDAVSCSAASEAPAWRHLRRLDTRGWRWVIVRRLSQVGPLAAAWRSLARLTRHTRAGTP